MRIPRYWAKSTATFPSRSNINLKITHLTCWGWSDVSLSDAVERGNERAKAIAAMWPKGEFDARHPPKRYSYGDRPLHEAVLDEWKNDAGETWAAVTRNAYGCEVLNTAAIMFVDIDLPEDSPGTFSRAGIKRLFGIAAPTAAERKRDSALGKIRATVAQAARLRRASVPDARRVEIPDDSWPRGTGFRGHAQDDGSARRRSAVREALQDAELLPRAADAQTVALRNETVEDSLSLAGRSHSAKSENLVRRLL